MKSVGQAIFCFCQQFTVFFCSPDNVQFHNKQQVFTQIARISLEIKDKAETSSLSLRRHAYVLAKRLMHMAHFSGNTSGVSKSSSDWLN